MKRSIQSLLSAIAIIFSVQLLFSEEIGNPLYSSQVFRADSAIEGGFFGLKDYFNENTTLSYTFRSTNRHAFTLRLKESVLLPGLFTDNLYRSGTLFFVSSGFEYTFKLFPPYAGISLFFDTGIGDGTFSLSGGIGVGSRQDNGVYFTCTYLHEKYFSSDIDFYVEVLHSFAFQGNLGLYVDLYSTDPSPVLKLGVFPGFYMTRYARCTIGGGLTVSDTYVFAFYIANYISVMIPM